MGRGSTRVIMAGGDVNGTEWVTITNIHYFVRSLVKACSHTRRCF